MNTEVTRNDDAQRYEVSADGTIGGVAEFVLDGDMIRFTHTEVFGEFRGQGLGDALAEGALTDATRRGLTIIPECPFIAKYLEEHAVSGAVVMPA